MINDLLDEDRRRHRVGVGRAPAGEELHGHSLDLVLGGGAGEVGRDQRPAWQFNRI